VPGPSASRPPARPSSRGESGAPAPRQAVTAAAHAHSGTPPAAATPAALGRRRSPTPAAQRSSAAPAAPGSPTAAAAVLVLRSGRLRRPGLLRGRRRRRLQRRRVQLFCSHHSPPSAMASSALRRSLPRRALLRNGLPFKRPPAASEFCRSYQSGDGETGETTEEFTERLFGSKGVDEGSLYRKLDRVENTSKRYGMGSGSMGSFSDRSSSGFMGGFGDRNSTGSIGSFGDRSSAGSWGGLDSLNDGMTEVLGNAARNFQMDDDEDGEDWDEDFDFRSDVDFRRGGEYRVRDLDLKRPAAAKNPPRPQFETTTAEVLRKADFRNVRFLSNFLTEAGIIIKRSQTRISAKAQRKIAREIKTARAFGLLPFTTMGRRPFIFGRSAEEHYSEEEYGFDFVKKKDGEPDEDNGDAELNVEAA
ncbi:unnamed protein product, partial [Urochloa humidicola]